MKITPIYKEIDKTIIEATVIEHQSSSENYGNWNLNEFGRIDHWLDTIKIEGDMVLALPREMKAWAGTKLRITVEKIKD
jgi:hypothetical protein